MSTVVEMKPIAWSGGFNDTANMVFPAAKMKKFAQFYTILNECWTIVKLLFNDC